MRGYCFNPEGMSVKWLSITVTCHSEFQVFPRRAVAKILETLVQVPQRPPLPPLLDEKTVLYLL